jgi:4-amino-4-deoxy-L-arabinose transferase-like glycosyltransferase
MEGRDVTMPWPLSIERRSVPLTVVLCIAVVLIAALRAGQEWDGDFALYIMNARNIVRGLPYDKTPYLFNPANTVEPASYPPGLPLLFAPIYALMGVNLVAMKLVCIAAFVAFLFVFHRMARSVLSPSYALAVTAGIGLHPYIFSFENSPGSEFPFMLFCYIALYAMRSLDLREGDSPRHRAALVAIAGIAVALAYLTRSIGVLLFPAAFSVSVLHRRRLVTPENVALVVAVAIVWLAQAAFPADIETYLHYFDTFSLRGLLASSEQYLRVFASLLGMSAVMHLKAGAILSVGFVALTIVGFVDRVRRRFAITECFFVIYGAFLLVYPLEGAPSRYSLPIWPLLFLYFAKGVELCADLCASWNKLAGRVFIAGVCTVVAALYGLQYASLKFDEIPFSVEARQSRELFESVRRDLPMDARILTRKPTIVALYTGHEAITWPEQFSDEELWAFLAQKRVDYVIQDIYHIGMGSRYIDVLDPFIQRNASRLQLVFGNEWFNVYKASPTVAREL